MRAPWMLCFNPGNQRQRHLTVFTDMAPQGFRRCVRLPQPAGAIEGLRTPPGLIPIRTTSGLSKDRFWR